MSDAMPSFASMARGESAQPEAVEPQEVEEVVQHEPEVLPEVQAEAEDTPAPEVEQPAERQNPSFENYMRAHGFDVPEDVDPEALYATAIERISASTQALSELETLRAEIARLKAAPAPQAAPPVAPPSIPVPSPEQVQQVVQEQQRIFQKLTGYDTALEQLVTRDGQGRAIARPELGVQALDAARTINQYEQLEREQAAKLLRDPRAIFEDTRADIEKLVEERANSLIEARFKAMQDQQAQREQQLTATQRAQAEEQAAMSWHEANKAKLFKLATNGEPMRMPFDESKYITTPTGTAFMTKYQSLQERFPGASRLDLMNEALEYATLAAPKAPEQVATPAQQRKAFVSQRSPHVSPPPATASELASTRANLRFADLARGNPETAEVVSNWRS